MVNSSSDIEHELWNIVIHHEQKLLFVHGLAYSLHFHSFHYIYQ